MEYPEIYKLDTPLVFDTHAHYTDEKFDGIRDELLISLNQNGVCGIITCGTSKESSNDCLKLANKYGFVYAAVGIHPEDINCGTDISFIKNAARDKKCVAVGEIGLDYYWEKENRNEQTELFEKQIILAKELDLPVIVHDREAHKDTLDLLIKHKPRGVVHCFSGSKEMAEEILKLNMYIGVGGVITFKNAKKLPEIIEIIPKERLLLETDCPYLAPEPHRGKLNHSGLIPFTAQKVADIYGISLNKLLVQTKNNAKELFGI